MRDEANRSRVVADDDAGATLAAYIHRHLGLSWRDARKLIDRGKIFIDDRQCLDDTTRLIAGARVEVRDSATPPPDPVLERAAGAVVYEDDTVVVIDKPAGLASVPFGDAEPVTAIDLVRDAWRARGRRVRVMPLRVVHRLDKETSGLLLFAKTREAERDLQRLWSRHDIERQYVCLAHGRVSAGRIESRLVADRGDGLRGSLPADAPASARGKRAVTHVRMREVLSGATLCEVSLETGRTHQIRIHLAEAGHPVVGEPVYIRDYVRRGDTPIDAPRLMLHAETLGFVHPVTGRLLRLVAPPPEEFDRVVATRRKR